MPTVSVEETGTGSEQKTTNSGLNYIILKWNNFDSFLIKSLAELFNRNELTDVSLVCEDAIFRSHKVILAMWSPYFRDIFLNTPCKHPVIILKDVSPKTMEHLLGYMYQGEIFIPQRDVHEFLALADTLKISGIDETRTQTAAVIPDVDLDKDEHEPINLYHWKPATLPTSTDVVYLPEPGPMTNDTEILDADVITVEEPVSGAIYPEQQHQPTIAVRNLLKTQEVNSETLTTFDLNKRRLEKLRLDVMKNLNPNLGFITPGISGQTYSTLQNSNMSTEVNAMPDCPDDEPGTPNPTESQDDLENPSSITMIHRHYRNDPETKMRSNYKKPHELLRSIAVKSLVTEKTTLLEPDGNESDGPSKRFKLEQIINSNSNLGTHSMGKIDRNVTLELRCPLCRINTYSKEAYDKHMQLHRKRKQFDKYQGYFSSK